MLDRILDRAEGAVTGFPPDLVSRLAHWISPMTKRAVGPRARVNRLSNWWLTTRLHGEKASLEGQSPDAR